VNSNKTNQTMRKLTALTISLMIPTLIAGIYGMNFHYIPELGWDAGYPFAIALMLVCGGAALLIFKRMDWL